MQLYEMNVVHLLIQVKTLILETTWRLVTVIIIRSVTVIQVCKLTFYRMIKHFSLFSFDSRNISIIYIRIISK